MATLKRLITTKTFWTGAAAVATGIGLLVNKQTTEGIVVIINGLGLIFVRDAISKG